jgi:hypothetical protein
MKFETNIKLKFLENLCKYRQLKCHLPYERQVCLGEVNYIKCPIYQEKVKQNGHLGVGSADLETVKRLKIVDTKEQTKLLKKALEDLDLTQ